MSDTVEDCHVEGCDVRFTGRWAHIAIVDHFVAVHMHGQAAEPTLRERIADLIRRELPGVNPPLLPADCVPAADAVIKVLQGREAESR